MGAWIEIALAIYLMTLPKSHPTWVRGLILVAPVSTSSPPVAPYMGAWIGIISSSVHP